MSYPYPADPTVIVDRIHSIVDAAKATFRVPVINVHYGDQDRLPNTPAICVETSDKTRELGGAPNMTLNTFEVFLIIYHNKVQSNELTRKEVDQIAYDVEFLLHQDLQLKAGTANPYMIHGFVTRSESGYTYKQNTLYRTARVTYTGKNKTSLSVA